MPMGELDHYSISHGVVHIIGVDPSNPEGLKAYLGDRDLERQVTIELNYPAQEAAA
jgi:hypothetical protein